MKKLLNNFSPEEYDCDCMACQIRDLQDDLKLIWAISFTVILGCLIWGGIFFYSQKILHPKTAAWYGSTDDHTDHWLHRFTATGESFNEDAMTAASWEYPLGARVRVINLDNHKSVDVRINDRGPSKRLRLNGRAIDLTKAAFARIADLKIGVIKVKIVKLP